jgi:hypothetical protein
LKQVETGWNRLKQIETGWVRDMRYQLTLFPLKVREKDKGQLTSAIFTKTRVEIRRIWKEMFKLGAESGRCAEEMRGDDKTFKLTDRISGALNYSFFWR